MKHPKTDAAMQTYVASCGGNKDKELQKFRDIQPPPRPIAVHRYKPLVAAAVILLVIGVSVLFLIDSPTSLSRIHQSSLATFPQTGGLSSDSSGPQYCTLNALLKMLPKDAQHFLDTKLLPRLICTEIEISQMTEKWGNKNTIGTYIDLKPLDNTVNRLTGYYISDGYNIWELLKYHNFSQQLLWNNCNIFYSIKEKSSVFTYRLYFQEDGFSCYIEIETSETQDLTKLLKNIFETH